MFSAGLSSKAAHGEAFFLAKSIVMIFHRPGRVPGFGESTERHTWYRKPTSSAMFQGTRKLSKRYTHTTLSMGWRPRSGRHPIEIVPCVYILDSFPVPWNMAEIGFLYHLCLSKSSVFCTICVSPCFPRIQGPYQAWNIITLEFGQKKGLPMDRFRRESGR